MTQTTCTLSKSNIFSLPANSEITPRRSALARGRNWQAFESPHSLKSRRQTGVWPDNGGSGERGAGLLRRARNFLPTTCLRLSLLHSRKVYPSIHFERLLGSVPVKEKSKASYRKVKICFTMSP